MTNPLVTLCERMHSMDEAELEAVARALDDAALAMRTLASSLQLSPRSTTALEAVADRLMARAMDRAGSFRW